MFPHVSSYSLWVTWLLCVWHDDTRSKSSFITAIFSFRLLAFGCCHLWSIPGITKLFRCGFLFHWSWFSQCFLTIIIFLFFHFLRIYIRLLKRKCYENLILLVLGAFCERLYNLFFFLQANLKEIQMVFMNMLAETDGMTECLTLWYVTYLIS